MVCHIYSVTTNRVCRDSFDLPVLRLSAVLVRSILCFYYRTGDSTLQPGQQSSNSSPDYAHHSRNARAQSVTFLGVVGISLVPLRSRPSLSGIHPSLFLHNSLATGTSGKPIYSCFVLHNIFPF